MQWSTEQLFKINTTWVTLVCPVQCALTSWTKWFWSQIRNIACILLYMRMEKLNTFQCAQISVATNNKQTSFLCLCCIRKYKHSSSSFWI